MGWEGIWIVKEVNVNRCTRGDWDSRAFWEYVCARWDRWADSALTGNRRDAMETNFLHSYGGREARLEATAKTEANRLTADGKEMAADARQSAEGIVDQAKQKAGELKAKVVK